jgi:zinc protease
MNGIFLTAKFAKCARTVFRLGVLGAFGGALFILVPPSPSPAQKEATAEKLFNAETFTLDNGMEIVVIPNRRAPVVTHMVWYKVGAADEAPGKSGVAHFLEHLMFKG